MNLGRIMATFGTGDNNKIMNKIMILATFGADNDKNDRRNSGGTL